ncbi:alpha/beta-hydrolase [Mollisia scopiformis]|uniref:Carboxylic ester hydrolase n=1 Tax=Mollisia scopiformis TaxID=149040 RepID=A0A194XVI2_MOLSC|nr:alpha/beta-hydrolase [Mollisia scopiformis]KUJ24335.1 alpha/beta-hydrolase [Mollisia scopiformis]
MILTLLLFIGFVVCTSYIGRQENGLDVFIGVPYAQPPVGSLRLQPPVPIAQDLGNLDVSNLTSNRCYELKAGPPTLSIGSEDCLTLDIVRPSQGTARARQNTKLPVYVFIHGGNFNDGDKSDYDGRNLVNTSVQLRAPFIYVAVNYRLGFLGFPSGQQLAGSYNLGLLDQRLALQWIQQEIETFGGDPTKVVIGGHSAGANSVAYQMMANRSETSDNLFRGAILESGSATALSAIQHTENGTWQASYDYISAAVGCNTTGSLTCLQSVPIENLVTAYTIGFAKSGFKSPIYQFSPVLDGDFITTWPSVLMDEGVFAKIPSIIGTTTSELVERVPIYNGIGDDAAVIQALEPYSPFVPYSSMVDLLAFYQLFEFQNVGPPLSGGQWSRTVAIENDIQILCSAYTQAIQTSQQVPTWKCKRNRLRVLILGTD